MDRRASLPRLVRRPGQCRHARRHDQAKDRCQFVCGNDPDAETLDGRAFLTLNGVQMLGHAHITVAGQIPDLASVRTGCLCESRILQE
ncbi:hypothetical protein [Paracoccus actinidiae]|uniref:hypothetical protein n=1 Tax=Paracoccus actinidiae TaxID=3064531 RepID=UPI0027D216A4|nr:hypothetical protein [Paracoccus sp. M09]